MAKILNRQLVIIYVSTALFITLSGCFRPTKRTKQPSPQSSAQNANARYRLAQDTAPHAKEIIPDLKDIPNAKPKAEPKSRYGNPKTYTVFDKSYEVLPTSKGYKVRGKASWYGKKFHGYRTSNGETYDMYSMSAAHKTLPLPTYAKVTNLDNGKTVVVKINDRGPFHADRIIDLSYAAAAKLGILGKGTGNVEVHAIDVALELPKQYLQIGAFSQEQNAKQMALKLKKITKDHPIEIRRNPEGKSKLYHVHVGPIQDQNIISQLIDKLVAHKFPTPIPVLLE
jgi:rare lipoprotein A